MQPLSTALGTFASCIGRDASPMQSPLNVLVWGSGSVPTLSSWSCDCDVLQVCLEYLERYYVLISYAAYLFDPNFDPDNPEQPSFGQWIKNRPELRRCAQKTLPGVFLPVACISSGVAAHEGLANVGHLPLQLINITSCSAPLRLYLALLSASKVVH